MQFRWAWQKIREWDLGMQGKGDFWKTAPSFSACLDFSLDLLLLPNHCYFSFFLKAWNFSIFLFGKFSWILGKPNFKFPRVPLPSVVTTNHFMQTHYLSFVGSNQALCFGFGGRRMKLASLERNQFRSRGIWRSKAVYKRALCPNRAKIRFPISRFYSKSMIVELYTNSCCQSSDQILHYTSAAFTISRRFHGEKPIKTF